MAYRHDLEVGLDARRQMIRKERDHPIVEPQKALPSLENARGSNCIHLADERRR